MNKKIRICIIFILIIVSALFTGCSDIEKTKEVESVAEVEEENIEKETNLGPKYELAYVKILVGQHLEAFEAIKGLEPENKEEELIKKKVDFLKDDIGVVSNTREEFANIKDFNEPYDKLKYTEKIKHHLDRYENMVNNEDKANDLQIFDELGVLKSIEKQWLEKLGPIYSFEIDEYLAKDNNDRDSLISNKLDVKLSDQNAQLTSYDGSIELEFVEFIDNGVTMSVVGNITNNKDYAIDYQKVKAIFYDSNNKIVDTDWTYAVDSMPLLSGEKRSFEILSKGNPKAISVTVEIFE